MNKQKPFSYKNQEIINEYNKKRNQEITKEHLNNIEKLRKDFKKEVINKYKEKLINYLNLCIEMDNKRLKMKHYNEDWIKGSIEQVQVVINVIKSGVFDND